MAQVAFVLADMYEDLEFDEPYRQLKEAGHQVVVIGREKGAELAGNTSRAVVDVGIAQASPGEFDALVIPGGYSPDQLRIQPDVVDFTREMVTAGKPVAAICHAGSLLIEADVVRGRQLTSSKHIRTDLRNAGARWVDEEVVVDGNLVTSRSPADLPAFCAAIFEQII